MARVSWPSLASLNPQACRRPLLPTVTFTAVGAAWRSREFSMETALPPVKTRMDVQAQRRPILPGLLRANGPALRVAARKGSPAARLECRSKICRQKCQRADRSDRRAQATHLVEIGKISTDQRAEAASD